MAKAQQLLVSCLLCVSAVHAANHYVGGTYGWSDYSDLAEWAAGERFLVADNLIFIYDETEFDVIQVAKDGYDYCDAIGALASYTGGNNTINLLSPSSIYFISSISDYCREDDVKLAITVKERTTGGTTPPSPLSTTPPSPDSTTPPSPETTTPPSPLSTTPTRPRSPPQLYGGDASGNFGKLNTLLVGFSLISTTLLSFMG